MLVNTKKHAYEKPTQPHAAPYCSSEQVFYITFYTVVISTTAVQSVVLLQSRQLYMKPLFDFNIPWFWWFACLFFLATSFWLHINGSILNDC